MNLAEKLDQEDPDAPSKKISPYFEPITQALIGASGRYVYPFPAGFQSSNEKNPHQFRR